jgi:hypothetical protein
MHLWSFDAYPVIAIATLNYSPSSYFPAAAGSIIDLTATSTHVPATFYPSNLPMPLLGLDI